MTNPPAPKPVPFTISSVDEQFQWLKAIFYGQPGVGKTMMAASASQVMEMRDVLFLDAEAGTKTLQGNKNIDVIRVTDYRTFARIAEFLRLHCRYRDEGNDEKLIELETRLRGQSVEKPRKYRTVVIDSLSEVQKFIMYQILGLNQNTASLDDLIDLPKFDAWNQNSEMVRLLVRSFRDLPMHTIFIFAEQEVASGEITKHKIDVPGKLAGQLPGFVDVVGYMAVAPNADGQLMRRLFLQPNPRYQAKNRLQGITATSIDDPTLQKLTIGLFGSNTKRG